MTENKKLLKLRKIIVINISWRELIFYHIFYWSAALFSLYKFFIFSQKFKKSLALSSDTRSSIFGPLQDQSEWEWNIFLPLLIECIPYTVIHLVISQFIRYCNYKIIRQFYVVYSSFVLIKILGLMGYTLCYIVPLVMFAALYSRRKSAIWLTWCCLLIIFNTSFFHSYLNLWLVTIPDGEFKTSVIVAWIILRSLSFALEICNEDPQRTKSSSNLLLTVLAYSLYLPFVVTGPFMPYSDFIKGLQKPYEEWSLQKILKYCLQFIRFAFWLYVTDMLLYFFYAHCMLYSPELLLKMTSWELGGYVYFLIIFFFLKYVVYYGLPSVFASADGFSSPGHPKCILLIHKFSQVWRYFDPGLYKFMIRHIYLPFINGDESSVRRVQGAAIVFTFVYVWHGVYPHIFWWSLLNFVGVLIERIIYNVAVARYGLRPKGRAEHCMIVLPSALLMIFSCISLVIFLSSIENAKIVADRIFVTGFPSTFVTTMCVFVCTVQCSFQLEAWRCAGPTTK